MNVQTLFIVSSLALAAGAIVAGSNAAAAPRAGDGDFATGRPGLLLAAEAKSSASATASASASSSASSTSKAGGCEVVTETRSEVRRGDEHRVASDRKQARGAGPDCDVSKESHSKVRLGRDAGSDDTGTHEN